MRALAAESLEAAAFALNGTVIAFDAADPDKVNGGTALRSGTRALFDSATGAKMLMAQHGTGDDCVEHRLARPLLFDTRRFREGTIHVA